MVTNNAWNSQDPAQVAKGGTGVASTTAYAVICGGTTTTAPLQSIAGVGTSGQVLTSNGAGNLPTFQAAGGGTFTKQVRASTSTAGSTTTVIPFDNTIPQITEGAEVITVSITPANSNNILVIEYSLYATLVASNAVGPTQRQLCSALFQDATADALYAQIDIEIGQDVSSQNWGGSVTGRYYMTAGTTSSTTFRLRVGPANSAYSYYWLSNTGTAIFSTVNFAAITVTEYTA